MKKSLLLVGALVVTGSTLGGDLLACGEKFLMPSRGTRHQQAAALRKPASILVYVNPASALPRALEKVPVDETLRKAGYTPAAVTGPQEFEQALRQGGWDLVLVDLAESASLRAQLRGANAPTVLPVGYALSRSELSQARKDYQHVLSGPLKSQAFLEAIDDALALRDKLRSKGA